MSPERVFLAIFLASLLGFGGLGSVPVLRSQLAAGGVSPDAVILPALAVGNISPGPNGLYLVAVGYFVGGVVGALLSVLALIIPPLLVLVLEKMRARLIHLHRFRGALSSLSLAVVGVLAVSTVSLVRHAGTNVYGIVFIVVGAAFLLRRVPPLVIVAVAVVVGVIAG